MAKTCPRESALAILNQQIDVSRTQLSIGCGESKACRAVMSDVRDLIKKAGAARRSDSDSGCKRVLQSTRALAYATGKIAGMRRR